MNQPLIGIERLLALPVERATGCIPAHPTTLASCINEQPSPTPKVQSITNSELRFLRAVIGNPGQPSSAYPALAGIGTHQAIAARKRLIEIGLIQEHRIQTKGRGRISIVLEPTSKALSLFAKKEN